MAAKVMTRPNIIRMGPPDLSRSSNLHGSLLAGYEANGTNPVGPMIKASARSKRLKEGPRVTDIPITYEIVLYMVLVMMDV